MDKEKTYVPPDENFTTIGAERFRCAEVLLLPDVMGEIVIGIHDTSLQSTMKCGVYACEGFIRFTGLDYDTELTSNPTNSQTETSSFVSVAWKRCSSQSRWPPDSTTLFLEQDAVVLSSGTTRSYERMLSPSTMKSRWMLHR